MIKTICKASLCIVAATTLSLSMGTAEAAPNKAQNRMKTCNATAKAKKLKGQARKDFMKQCLKAKPASKRKPNAAQQRMKDCNAKAKGMKGPARKKFMSQCLKKKS